MNLQISGQHVEVTPALKAYALDKVKRMERHFDHLIDGTMVLSVEKSRHKAEITVHARGCALHAEATEDSMYAALDIMADRLDQQVRKTKEKTRDHHAREVAHHQVA